MPMLTLKAAATEIGVSKRWLQYWLAEHPADNAGKPFYIPIGRFKRFEETDIQRIRDFLREREGIRLRPQPAPRGHTGVSAEVLSELVISSVIGPRKPQKKPMRRVRLPRA
ncbi:hypothetical protein [Bradyrhizobium sp. 150]|uniref:hypothetical protein n=1 Tax=Bradyrhizobium sp. 150 TaxID=2782625 RepID=UPI001FFA28B5|nr:hypothetical protein [Bradyrhizobium sp. 150]MCK1671232.1 hypothetical protein [Bradyrhizobium sp. 150]